jgi:hypothetical protein
MWPEPRSGSNRRRPTNTRVAASTTRSLARTRRTALGAGPTADRWRTHLAPSQTWERKVRELIGQRARWSASSCLLATTAARLRLS